MAAEKIQSYEQNTKKARELLASVSENLPKIREILERSENATETRKTALKNIENELPHLSEILQKITDISQNSPNISLYSEKISNTALGYFSVVEMFTHDAVIYTDFAYQKAENLQETLTPILQNTQEKMLRVSRALIGLEKFFTKINTLTKEKTFNNTLVKTQNLSEKIANYISINRQIYRAINRGEEISENLLISMMNAANAVNASLVDFREYFSGDFLKNMQEVDKFVVNIFEKINSESQNLNAKIPEIQTHISEIHTAIEKGNEKISEILTNWGKIENAVYSAEKIFAKMDDERVASLLEIMLLNPDDEKNFFRQPVEIQTTSLFAVPNYGSAIAPFFTVLALWTGALLASSILSVRSKKALKEKNIRHGYMGRLLFFMTIGVGQATIITLGNIWMLGVYVVHPWMFFVGNLLIVTLFHAIIFLVVFLFGKIGNVLAILFLLLQLSAGSGTFPVELTNGFFVKIHPYMPFTYAINLLREVSLGIVDFVLWWNVGIIMTMLTFSLVIGIFLAPHLSPFAIKFNKRTEGMDIFN